MYSQAEVQEFLRTQVARPASAGVLLCDTRGRALVLKAHYKPYWSFPGGWIEAGQTPRDAALRELAEEAGIALAPSEVRLLYTINRASSMMQSYQFIFAASGVYDDATSIRLQAEEINDYKFVSKADVLADLESFGGAVQLWAQGATQSYYEQQL